MLFRGGAPRKYRARVTQLSPAYCQPSVSHQPTARGWVQRTSVRRSRLMPTARSGSFACKNIVSENRAAGDSVYPAHLRRLQRADELTRTVNLLITRELFNRKVGTKPARLPR